MHRRAKWLWIVTVANAGVAALMVLIVYAVMLALAVLAPEISGWPVFVALLVGVVLSVIGLRLAMGEASRLSRIISRIVNGCALSLNLLVIVITATIFIRSTNERFVIPDGYKGDVYVVYGRENCVPLPNKRGRITYVIPGNGILPVCGIMSRNWTKTDYYYQTGSGKLERIRNFWPTTIHPTPENLANNSDIGVFFPRTGGGSDSTGCTVEFQLFYVGTKQHLLTQYKPTDLGAYLRAHPVGCR